MAKPNDTTADGGQSGGGFMIAAIALSLLGAAAGAGASLLTAPVAGDVAGAAQSQTGGKPHASDHAGETKASNGHGSGSSTDASQTGVAVNARVDALEPIHVTLAGGGHNQMRLDASLVGCTVEGGDTALLQARITQDFVMFLKTLELSDVESSSGLEFLRADLAEVARLRAKNTACGVLVRSVMFE